MIYTVWKQVNISAEWEEKNLFTHTDGFHLSYFFLLIFLSLSLSFCTWPLKTSFLYTCARLFPICRAKINLQYWLKVHSSSSSGPGAKPRTQLMARGVDEGPLGSCTKKTKKTVCPQHDQRLQWETFVASFFCLCGAGANTKVDFFSPGSSGEIMRLAHIDRTSPPPTLMDYLTASSLVFNACLMAARSIGVLHRFMHLQSKLCICWIVLFFCWYSWCWFVFKRLLQCFGKFSFCHICSWLSEQVFNGHWLPFWGPGVLNCPVNTKEGKACNIEC